MAEDQAVSWVKKKVKGNEHWILIGILVAVILIFLWWAVLIGGLIYLVAKNQKKNGEKK